MTKARIEGLTSWESDWSGLRVLVLGMGVTGFSVVDTLMELHCEVVVATPTIDETHRQILEVLGAELLLADLNSAVPDRAIEFDPELLIVSPGFAPHHPIVKWVESTNAQLWGDIELAWRVRDKFGSPAEWICVTGTNGKTTTTELTASILRASGFKAVATGNVGFPILDAIRDPYKFEVLVVELSSFQLHYLGEMHPWSSVCLNIADDHLDWHSGAENYRKAKGKIYENTKVACIYNRDDLVTRTLVENANVEEGCRAIGFGLGVPGPSDFGIVGGIACDRAFLEDRANQALELFHIEELAGTGLDSPHLLADCLAASALARSFGAEIPALAEAILSFRPSAHRMEVVESVDGIAWIDDSKATNPHAASASLSGFESVVWIVGGLFKGAPTADLVAKHASRLKAAIVIGVERAEIIASLTRHAPGVPVVELEVAQTGDVMQSAVAAAADIAKPGDVVLLAPAAASMDQFIDYADRGRQFAQAVKERIGGSGSANQSSTGTTPETTTKSRRK
ncbi:MAG: UDP-N-acetylmuramoyl-L-alanine--D-glutamate ligase [Microbacteriaceae bacterium]|nr:UDP-N-acetylmuramoyl-L-alanine--D-glutamate ligase [Microbacteriaceae bacterium]